jgi:hypothetical protein
MLVYKLTLNSKWSRFVVHNGAEDVERTRDRVVMAKDSGTCVHCGLEESVVGNQLLLSHSTLVFANFIPHVRYNNNIFQDFVSAKSSE